MKFIAHRGLFQGPDKDKENNPDQICEALRKGFDVEIDLRCDENNNLFLGHDYNQYPISKDFLLDSIDRFWIHCKDLEALNHINLFQDANYFWHQEDDYTLTSKNFVWVYPGKKLLKSPNCSQTEYE